MLSKRFRSVRRAVVGASLGIVALLFPLTVSGASAATSVSYDFNSPGDLSSGFSNYVSSGTIVQSASGGIGNSGAINVSSQTANGVFASLASYSMGPVGSSYTFSAYMQSVGNSGYSGMGFTSLPPASGNASGNPYRPTDALGVSVHGGGFVFHNGATDVNGSWGNDNQGIVTVTRSTMGDLLNSGSTVDWYKVFLIITRDSATTFDMRVEVWPSNADGTLISPGADSAIFELRDQTNTTLTSAPSIKTYLNFSGDRVYYFDNYQVSLAGGSTVIQAGAPVVLTTAVVAQTNTVALDGSVTADGGTSVIERGFVYGSTTDPTITDYKVPSGTGIGSFTEITPQLPNGTYYFRAFATNGTGTSYGVTQSVTITGSSVQAMPGVTPVADPDVRAPAVELAETGSAEAMLWVTSALLLALFGAGAALTLSARRRTHS